MSSVTDAFKAQNLIREAFPVNKYGTAGAAIWAAYRQLKLNTERRARTIWEGKAPLIRSCEMESLQDAALKQARRDYIDAKNRIAAFEARQAERHAHFHSPDSNEVRTGVRDHSRMD